MHCSAGTAFSTSISRADPPVGNTGPARSARRSWRRRLACSIVDRRTSPPPRSGPSPAPSPLSSLPAPRRPSSGSTPVLWRPHRRCPRLGEEAPSGGRCRRRRPIRRPSGAGPRTVESPDGRLSEDRFPKNRFLDCRFPAGRYTEGRVLQGRFPQDRFPEDRDGRISEDRSMGARFLDGQSPESQSSDGLPQEVTSQKVCL